MKRVKVCDLLWRLSRKTSVKIAVSVIMILWLGFIFSRSVKPAESSNKESMTVVRMTADALESLTNQKVVSKSLMSHKIRKMAHFTEFAILGVLSCAAFSLWLGRKFHSLAASLAFSFGAACADEFIQTFAEGRSGGYIDVLIDSGGALAGITAAVAFFLIVRTVCLKK